MKKLSLTLLMALSLPTLAAVTDISTVPIEKSAVVPPNLVFGLDDSGSMDWEVLLNGTQDGKLWYNTTTNKYYDNNNFVFGGSSNTEPYGYLFPLGSNSDARRYTDSDGEYAVPPIPEFAFTRCAKYNPVYYNPSVTYKPWAPAYYSGSTKSFSNSNPLQASSHPIFTGTTADLTVTTTSQATDYTFRMFGGMVIPGSTVTGIKAITGTCGGNKGTRWCNINSDMTVPDGTYYDVSIPYYPATYYVVDSTCTSGVNCAVAPDGAKLRRYEIKSGNTFPSGRTYTDEMQNFANWFTYYRKRKLHVASAMSSVLPTLQGIRGGIVKFNNRSTVTMYDFNAPSDSGNERALLGVIYQNASSGGTPTRETLAYIGEQYRNNKTIVQYGCQLNSAMIVTDGFANGSTVSVPSYTQSTYGGKQPYTTTYSGTLADLALAYYTLNIRPDLPAGLVTNGGDNTQPSYDANPNLHMNSYAISLAQKGTIYGTGVPAATDPYKTYPTWPNPGFNSDPTAVDDLWHATINGRGLMYSTPDIQTLTSQILNIFTTVLIQSGSSSAVGVVQTYISTSSNLALLASYLGMTGDLQQVPIDTSTGQLLTSQVIWSAQALVDAMTPANRIIATYNGTSGVPFEWANMTATQQTQLGTQQVLNWLRGDKTNEGTTYRARNHILGDIVNAEPVVINGAVGSYSDTGYAAFANSVASRPSMVYQGANDGMLHAFDKITGQERWAYVPNLLFSNLNSLSNLNYTHTFYVDGTPSFGDIYDGSVWKTILVGGLRAGGKGYYALDVTSPGSASNETAMASKVLWEFPNSATSSSVTNNMGLSYGKPVIVKTAAAGWVVLVTSGYNNTAGDGHGHLFVLNSSSGAVIKDFDTGVGNASTPAGLAQIAAYAANAQTSALASQVYGGDLLGNVWRFDLSDASISNWNVKLLAKLVDNSGNAQPITTEPEIGVYNNQRFVFVGTGQLLGLSDITTTQQQTMYALVDNLSSSPTITPLRSSLAARTVSGTTITGVAYNALTYRGWYIDFPSTGERLNVNPVLAFGTLLFNTNVPSPSACGSLSYQYVVSLKDGLPLPATAFPSGVTPWARRLIGSTLVSKPTVIVLSNGMVVSLNHKSDNTIDTNQVPQNSASTVNKVAWKEVLSQ